MCMCVSIINVIIKERKSLKSLINIGIEFVSRFEAQDVVVSLCLLVLE